MMLKKIYSQILGILLDKNEKKFINHCDFKKKDSKNNVLIIAPNDYYYVCYNYILSKEKLSNFNIYGYWPYSVTVTRKRIFQKIHELKSNIYFNLLKKK